MEQQRPINGWLLTLSTLFLGPIHLFFSLLDTRARYGFSRYLLWVPPLFLLLFAYAGFSLSYNPYLIRFIYLFILVALTAALFIGSWITDCDSVSRERRPHHGLNLSRALAWTVFMSMLFPGLAKISQTAYFWLFGEFIPVSFSGQTDIFFLWLPIGCLYGFLYGLFKDNTYMDQNIQSFLKSILLLFCIIAIFSLCGLFLIIYPLQRLTPISYAPQTPDFIFYGMVCAAIPVFITSFMKRTASRGALRTMATMPAAILLIILHAVLLSGYTVTMNLTFASILEDDSRLEQAEKIYGKCIPYIRHDNLLASLYHRRGVLHVINGNYDQAIQAFKKVMADYSDTYEVYRKARQYVTSYENNSAGQPQERKILNVHHQTFEQAASCFPNSLSVILNFYEQEPVDTRKLSSSIKEGFSQGTFIWKAQSFLEKNGYRLVTTFWQDRDTLVSLLNKGYPVLIYIPGHVYTLYGYDAGMEMFFTYDTAKSNRWNDNPFQNLLKAWMDSGFLMSVVVPEDEQRTFEGSFPQISRYTSAHQAWQKFQITRYNTNTSGYWHDFDPFALAETLGFDRLKINEPYFLDAALPDFTWDSTLWDKDMIPVWQQPWAIHYDLFQQHLLDLLFRRQTLQARQLTALYLPHYQKEYSQAYAPFFELQLAVALAGEDNALTASLSDNLIGLTDNSSQRSHWGHYLKAKGMIEAGNFMAATQLLLPIINSMNLNSNGENQDMRAIMNLYDEIARNAPELLDEKTMNLLRVARIHLAADNG